MNSTHRGAVRATFLCAGAMAVALAGCSDDPAGPDQACDSVFAPPHCPGPPGTFAFLPEVSLPIAFTGGSTDRSVVKGDFNGDGRMDIAFVERRNSPSLNRVHVAFGQADGSFNVAAPNDHDQVPPEGWGTYEVLVGDLNGDGRDDLIWNHRGTSNVVYVGLSAGDGGFTFGARQVHPLNGWGTYTAAVGDMNNDGKDDIVWNNRLADRTRTYIGFATGTDGTLTMVNNAVDRLGNYIGYRLLIGEVNGDGNRGILLNSVGSTHNTILVGTVTPVNSEFSISWTVSQGGSGWGGFYEVLGNVDGRNGDDIVWFGSQHNQTVLRTALNHGTGTFNFLPGQQIVPLVPTMPVELADFNGDGRADVLVNDVGNFANELIVGFGSENGFVFESDVQTNHHAAQPIWSYFRQRFVGDITGDGRADIVWITNDGPARLFVALPRPSI